MRCEEQGCPFVWLALALGWLIVGLSPIALAQSPDHDAGWQTLEQRGGQGEQCLVCRKAIHEEDVVEIRYKGRTFHVAASMLDVFEQSPDEYFQALQARSALFDERAHEGNRASWGWVALGCYALLGLIFAAVCGYLAIRRHHAPLPWFFAGLVGNVAALVLLLVAPPGNPANYPVSSHGPVACPACGAANHPAARACGRCQTSLTPQVASETARALASNGGAA